MPVYSIRLDEMKIDEIRSQFNDTDFAMLSVKVGDKVYGPVTKALGKVKKGVHGINLSLDDIVIRNDDTNVIVIYEIINSGHESTDKIQLKVKETAEKIFKNLPYGGYWSGLGGWLLNELMGIFVANCDGPVAADGLSFSGKELYKLTSDDGQHALTKFYPGLDSPVLCGDNSKYHVTWSMHRAVLPADRMLWLSLLLDT